MGAGCEMARITPTGQSTGCYEGEARSRAGKERGSDLMVGKSQWTLRGLLWIKDPVFLLILAAGPHDKRQRV